MIAHTNRAAWEIHIINNGTAWVKTEVQQQPSEAAADEDSGSWCWEGLWAQNSKGHCKTKNTVNFQESKAAGRG